jgi:hypothetical protein
MEHCATVVTFGSTMGAEATFWSKPSILLGRAAYEGLGVAHEPRTYEEFEDLVLDSTLTPRGRLAAFKYGYWAAEAGDDVRVFADMVQPDQLIGYDRIGVKYQRVMMTLLKAGYPITYTPFYHRILRAVANRSRRDFYEPTS